MITIQYDFSNHWNASSLEQLNAMLRELPLADLCLEDSAGYLSPIKNRNGTTLGHRCEPERGTLKCRLAHTHPGHQFQLDTFTGPITENHESRIQGWEDSHPGREVTYTVIYRFSQCNTDAYLIVHQNRR